MDDVDELGLTGRERGRGVPFRYCLYCPRTYKFDIYIGTPEIKQTESIGIKSTIFSIRHLMYVVYRLANSLDNEGIRARRTR